MICQHCTTAPLQRDANGQWECPNCGDHPGPMRGIDLADLAVPESETSEELRARHDAQVAAASPGVHRIVIEVGPGQRVETVDPRDEEIAALKQRLSFAAGCLKRGWQAQALRVLRDEEDVPKWFEELGGVPE